jgi:hypothetical protein
MNNVKMKTVKFLLLISMFSFQWVSAQKIAFSESNLVANKVAMSIEKFQGKQVVKVAKDPAVKEVDEPTFVRIKNLDFTDGDIEVSVLSRLLPTAAPSDRGFIGVAFRINDSNTAFECIYIRPTNGRAEDQVRRNHSIQYFSYPEYKFSRLRKENPEMYESYADMGLNEWIKMKIVVQDNRAKLFLNNQQQPSLIINDLKHGAGVSGAIGLFVDVGTEGYFKDLRVNIRK